jgi:hypothetical protein
MTITKTLAYYVIDLITVVKHFMTQRGSFTQLGYKEKFVANFIK